MEPSGDKVLEIFQKAQQFKICPNRIWAVAGENLPNIIPDLHLILAQDGSQANEHDKCTSEFCEQAQRDFTGVQQRHECTTGKCAQTMSVAFPRDVLYRAAINEKLTVWDLSGTVTLKPNMPYMAISHVWSDGTGAALGRTGLSTSACGISSCSYYRTSA
ncbi:hypothetical protein N7540_000003 [Penicillium herquei]|nr:hypothetical protein N7540_000003 [Penicillium herquei]